jgi:hypothetical protein
LILFFSILSLLSLIAWKNSAIAAFMKKIFAHFKTIKGDPAKFILWLLTSIMLSLSSFWIPLLIGRLIGQDYYPKLMENNPFIVFSIVFLCNSVLTSINYTGAGSNTFAVAIRGITLILTIMYLILLSSLVTLKLVSNITLSTKTQFILLGITVFLGIYVYGFRDSKWESSVDDFRKQQDDEVADIASKGKNVQNDGEVKL